MEKSFKNLSSREYIKFNFGMRAKYNDLSIVQKNTNIEYHTKFQDLKKKEMKEETPKGNYQRS